MRFYYLFYILCYIRLSAQKSTPEDTDYVAAVLEYEMQSTTAMNLDNYVNYIHDAAAQNADIVVFPEMTLARGGSVAVPIYGLLKEYPIPALQPTLYDEILVQISEAARQSQIYVVINLQEILNCADPGSSGEECPAQRRYLFNTNVVFDRTGAIIDRYRKINLFGEFSRTPALTPELGVFKTDFGVTFGHYICFDLMFQNPAIQSIAVMNITDVIFSTMWFSEMPFLTAVQIQQAYAYSMNVNFLAAGANNPKVGSAGSGIYSGRAGALVSIMPGLPTSRLLVATVPKVPGEVTGRLQGPILHTPLDQDNLILISDPSLESHQTRLLTNETKDFILTDKDVICHFRVRMRKSSNETETYRYRASAFSGVRSFSGMATGGNRLCAIFACTGNTIDTCGKRFDTYTRRSTVFFEQLEVTANVPMPLGNSSLGERTAEYFPVSLTSSLMPVKNDQIFFQTLPTIPLNIHIMILTQPTDELYSFGVWGREYTRDEEPASPPVEHDVTTTTRRIMWPTTTPAPNTPGGSVSHHISLSLLIFSILLLLKQIHIE